MSNLILNYAVKFTQTDNLPAPSLGFLHEIGVVVKKSAQSDAAVKIIQNGTSVTPAIISAGGYFKKGSEISIAITTDTETATIYYISTRDMFDFEYIKEIEKAFLAHTPKLDITTELSGGRLAITLGTSMTKLDLVSDESKLISLGSAEIIEVYNKDELSELAPSEYDQIGGLFDAGLNRISLIILDKIEDLKDAIDNKETDFYTIVNTGYSTNSDFLSATSAWRGVRGLSSDDKSTAKTSAILKNTCVFYIPRNSEAVYKMFYTFGSLLSANTWRNQQYVSAKTSEGAITTLGEAESLFNDRISFYLTDDTMGTRLGFFVAGGESITKQYISKELELTTQYKMANFLAVNQPFNVALERAELERIGNQQLQKFLEMGYLDPEGENSLTVTKSNEVFVVDGKLTTTAAVALWRIKIDSYQTQV